MRKPRRPNSKLPSNVHPVMLQLVQTRISLGLTQVAIADSLGYHNKTVSYNERQERSTSFAFVVDYADYLGYDLALVPKQPNS